MNGMICEQCAARIEPEFIKGDFRVITQPERLFFKSHLVDVWPGAVRVFRMLLRHGRCQYDQLVHVTSAGSLRVVQNYISLLRRELKRAGAPVAIKNHRNTVYYLEWRMP